MPRIPKLAFLLLPALYAQAPPTATIEGRVYNAQTGDPVRKARILVRRWNGRRAEGAYGATTDAAGRYVIDGIEPGVYGVRATRNGFTAGSYGQRKATGRGMPLTLAKGQHVRNIDLRLLPQAVVSGSVLDDDNEGIPGVEVVLVSQRYDEGRRVLSATDSAETDDRGTYRIFGVAPGRYYLAAIYHGELHDQQAETLSEKLGSYAPVYYPDSLGSPAAASQLTATPGAEIAGMDFHLRRVHLARVSGRIANAPSAASRQVNVMLMSLDGAELSWGVNKQQVVDHTGRFAFHDCPPGEYTLVAQFFAGKQRLSAMMPLTVSNSDIDGLTLNLLHYPDVAGQVRLEGIDAKMLPGLGIYLSPMIQQEGVPGAQAEVAADGAFKLSAVAPNRYRLMALRMPDEAYLKAVRAGGIESPDGIVDFRKGAPADLTVVVSGRGAQLSGKVRNGATVLLAPDRRDRYDLYKSDVADQTGAFTIKGIAPGPYKLFAFDQLDTGAWEDPDFLTPWEKYAQPIEIHEGDRLTKDLDVIATPPGT
ncbi:MAG TPA: carboxypeptidase-like regulatory domain-containing protein [Bryobacteraceae bacterium]|nr:carboxypeptidase-like regulatory domain-containing protein [Bryobacteraceae bacterium]